MAALLCMGTSTFREYVKRGLFPKGILIGSLRRWKVMEISERLDALQRNSSHSDDPFLERLRGGNGQKPSSGSPNA
jgi:predicted DNA-binding transcriptional regulator AlpA